jgi:cytochrome c
MGAPEWTESEPRFLALKAFLDAGASSGTAPDLSFEIVEPEVDVSGGDREQGRALFDETCTVCHGPGGVGTTAARVSSAVSASLVTSLSAFARVAIPKALCTTA